MKKLSKGTEKKSTKSTKKAGAKTMKTAKKPAKSKKRSAVKPMKIREIASVCAEQLREQHKAYQKHVATLDSMEEGATISVEKARKMLDQVVMSDRDAMDIINGHLAFALSEIENKGIYVFPGIAKVLARYSKPLPARPGRNPATGATIKLKARKASWKAAARPMKAAKDSIAIFSKKNPAK